MARTVEVRILDAAGVVQGITLVTFPAASAILTSPTHYDLSSTRYGAMFLPQVALAIAASLLGPGLARRITLKRVLLFGLVANVASMLLLLLSATVQTQQSVAFPLLLASTACLGLGFGLTVPALNTFVAAYRPQAADRAVLVLNALLGLGTALAPVFVAVFDGLGFWWGLPILSSCLLVVLLLGCLRLPLDLPSEPAPVQGRGHRGGIPGRFWLFAAFALLYGVCETMNGNWSSLYMTGSLGASTAQASIALAAFWAMVTVGRVLFAAIQRLVPSRLTYHVLPFVVALAFLLVASLGAGSAPAGVATFALAGLGCSALLPLTISFGQGQLVTMSAAVAGGIIAFYQVGYGLAAFGVGPVVDAGHSLAGIFRVSAAVAAVMGVVSFEVARRSTPSTATSPTATESTI
jgi:fucose permease